MQEFTYSDIEQLELLDWEKECIDKHIEKIVNNVYKYNILTGEIEKCIVKE